MYYLNARYYKPQVGRFITRDVIADKNLYQYSGDNPVMYVDPSGYREVMEAFYIGSKEDENTAEVVKGSGTIAIPAPVIGPSVGTDVTSTLKTFGKAAMFIILSGILFSGDSIQTVPAEEDDDSATGIIYLRTTLTGEMYVGKSNNPSITQPVKEHIGE